LVFNPLKIKWHSNIKELDMYHESSKDYREKGIAVFFFSLVLIRNCSRK